jgi:hypothetical protein
MKTFRFALAALTAVGTSFAQTPTASRTDTTQKAIDAQQQRDTALATGNALATSACAYPFTSGTGDTFLEYCVTVNGNITQLESPQGHEHVAVGSFAEGYLLCDNSTHPSVAYFDYADFGESGNWQPSVLVSQSATSVRISRTTVDGVWTLTQVITQSASTAEINVTMAVKNNSTTARPLSLERYIDVDADGTFFNSLDATLNTALAWQASAFGVANGGISMELLSSPGFTHAAVAHNYPNGPTCTSPATPGTLLSTDGSLVQLFFGQQPLAGGRTAQVSIRYKPL